MDNKIKLEIERNELLKLKSNNYEVYQLLCFLKLAEDLDCDYCETLDKAKLARECELGYFKIEDLFTKKQIISAYENNLNTKIYSLMDEIKKAVASEITPPKDNEYYTKSPQDFISNSPYLKYKFENLLKGISAHKMIWMIASIKDLENIQSAIGKESPLYNQMDCKIRAAVGAGLDFIAFYFYGKYCGWDRVQHCDKRGLKYNPLNDNLE